MTTPSWFQTLLEQLRYNPADPLLFNSAFFLFFFGIFLLIYQFIYKQRLTRTLVISLFSLYFFYKACGWYVGFIVLAAVIDFFLSNRIADTTDKLRKKLLLLFSIGLNLGLLFYFKYTDFFIDIWNDFSQGQVQPLNLVLPIGISFYTFENLSYTVDVYRGQFKPVRRFIDYLFFLSFFPKLVMGPIVRAADFIPQIDQSIRIDKDRLASGLWLICGGLLKKVMISDYIYSNFVENIFDNPSLHSGLECLFGVYGYALVIYCDFSGYSDMAIGMAKWMGFDININFRTPYQSGSITEFWRRWHISLSSWLKDYLYIPLGGNRVGKFRQQLNLMTTMLLGGLWHGASWNFVIWGGMHGLALALDKLRIQVFQKMGWTTEKKDLLFYLLRGLGILFTFHLVCFCWIFFKADSFEKAQILLTQISQNMDLRIFAALMQGYWQVWVVMGIGFLVHFVPESWDLKAVYLLKRCPWWIYTLLLTATIILSIQFKQAEPVLPIYLQF